jgi:hypothetical protein
MTNFYKYGIANGLYKIFDGADTLREAREMVRAYKAEDGREYHIYLLDKDGHIKTWIDRVEDNRK